jgi:hypothetical protein
MWRSLIIASALLVASACQPSSTISTSAAPARDVLFAQEIASARVMDAYEAVTQLRPEFLKRRGVSLSSPVSRGGIRVYLDNTEMGGVDILRTIPIDQVTTIRYLNASEASFRWGANHTGGVILVSTARTLR